MGYSCVYSTIHLSGVDYLKMAGVFDTPLIVEAIPYISAGYVLGRMFQKLEGTVNNVEKMGEELKGIGNEIKSADKRIHVPEVKDGLKNKKGGIKWFRKRGHYTSF